MAMHPAFQLDWNLMRSFVAVVKGGSLAAGARQLGLAHPTIARHIQQLEERLAMPLFDRTASGLVLNGSGSQIAAAAEAMQQAALGVQSASEALKTQVAGTVRVTISELLAEPMPRLLAALGPGVPETGTAEAGGVDERPNVELIVANQQLNLLQRDADIAIRHIRPNQSELVCRRLGELAIGAFASRDYLNRHGPVTAENMPRHWFVDGLQTARLRDALAQRGLFIPGARLVYRCDSLACQIRAAESGWGITAMPLYLADSHPLLQPLATDMPPALVDVWIAARPEVRAQRTLRLAFDQLTEAVSGLLAGAPRALTAAVH